MSTERNDPARNDRPDPDSDTQLDAELRALFHDERLDVRPRPQASQWILTGVRRRRRRRAALAGAGTTLALAAVAGSVLVLRGAGMPDGHTEAHFAAPPPTSAESSAGAATALPPPSERMPDTPGTLRAPRGPAETPSAAASGGRSGTGLPPEEGGPSRTPIPVIRADGYRALELGMSYRRAVETDMLRVSGEAPSPATCASYALVEGRDAVDRVTISARHGIVDFEVTGAHTEGGVGVGVRAERMRATYPGGRYETVRDESGARWSDGEMRPEAEYVVERPAGSFHFAVRDETVIGMRLTAHRSDC